MTKLSRVTLVEAFDPDSDDRQLGTAVLIAGTGRKDTRGAPVTDVHLDDDADRGRVWVRVPGRPDTFIPYVHVKRAVVAAEPEPVKLVQAAGKNRK